MRYFSRFMLATITVVASQTGLTAPPGKPSVASALQRRTTVQWQGITLRDAASRISDTQGIPILIDRRIDPGQMIELKANQQPLHKVLEVLAQLSDAKLLELQSLVYIGPYETVATLPTLLALGHDQLSLAPTTTQQRLLRTQPVTWPRLSTPQYIVGVIAQRTGIEIIGRERLPHDLWDAGSLPADSAANQLTLLLAEFDLAWQYDKGGNVLQIVPIEHPVRIARTYDWRNITAAQLQQVAAEIPAANVRMTNGKVVVDGPIEDHDKLAAILSKFSQSRRTPLQSKRRPAEKKLYSLRLEGQSLGRVLRELARQLKLELRVNPTAEPSLEKLISLDVKQVELEKLLAEIGDLAGVQIVLTDTELRVKTQ